MNHLIEQLVKDFRNHHQELASFAALAIEVYIAYLLEKLIERFHEAIAKILRLISGKIKEGWEVTTKDVITCGLATIRKMSTTLLQTAKGLRGKLQTFFC